MEKARVPSVSQSSITLPKEKLEMSEVTGNTSLKIGTDSYKSQHLKRIPLHSRTFFFLFHFVNLKLHFCVVTENSEMHNTSLYPKPSNVVVTCCAFREPAVETA